MPHADPIASAVPPPPLSGVLLRAGLRGGACAVCWAVPLSIVWLVIGGADGAYCAWLRNVALLVAPVGFAGSALLVRIVLARQGRLPPPSVTSWTDSVPAFVAAVVVGSVLLLANVDFRVFPGLGVGLLVVTSFPMMIEQGITARVDPTILEAAVTRREQRQAVLRRRLADREAGVAPPPRSGKPTRRARGPLFGRRVEPGVSTRPRARYGGSGPIPL